jgi:TrmH family RNA methyltransferase
LVLTKAEIHRVRELREKKNRVAAGLFVVEGVKVVAELLAAGSAFESIYATAEWTGPKTQAVSDEEMARISHFPTPSPVLAVGRLIERTLEPAALNSGMTLMLDGVQDPGNVGTLIRIADWFGLDRVVLSPDSADLHSQKVINASMGSFARLPAFRADLAKALAGVTVPVLGCVLDGQSAHQLKPRPHAVVAIGSEGRGLSAPVLARVTERITIPRHGRAESLNAAVAAGIVCALLRP